MNIPSELRGNLEDTKKFVTVIGQIEAAMKDERIAPMLAQYMTLKTEEFYDKELTLVVSVKH